jgi:hypothetical protein
MQATKKVVQQDSQGVVCRIGAMFKEVHFVDVKPVM